MKFSTAYLLLVSVSVLSAISAPSTCRAQGYTITTVAGGGSVVGNGGMATSAMVVPNGVAVDRAGNLYISEPGYGLVRRVTPDGRISPFAGTLSASGYSGDGSPALGAQLNFPAGLCLDSGGNLYIADYANGRVRKVDGNGVISTVAGGGAVTFPTNVGDGGLATQALIGNPSGVAADAAGNLYIADSSAFSLVRKATPDGTITTAAGLLPSGSTTGFTPIAKVALNHPYGVAVDSSGVLYIADTFNNRILRVSDSSVTTVAGNGSGSYSGDGGPANQAGISQPRAVAVDAAGNIFIADTGDQRIRMITADGLITTIAGNGQVGGAGDNGPASSATLDTPVAIALGADGKIYVANSGQSKQQARVSLLSPTKSPTGSPPSISAGGVVSAGAFGGFTSVAAGSWIEIYGSNLATGSRSWTGADFNGVHAPTSLDGTSVTIAGQQAFISYISPGQVNAQVPSNIGTGMQLLVVTTSDGASTAYQLTVNSVQPGLLAPPTFNIGGKLYVAAFFRDGTTFVLPPGVVAGVPSRRAAPGDTITFYGVGFGSVVPDVPAGEVAEGTTALAQQVHFFFGSTEAVVSYSGLAPGLVGVDQFNVVVPGISSSDSVPLTFKLGQVTGSQTLYTAVQNPGS